MLTWWRGDVSEHFVTIFTVFKCQEVSNTVRPTLIIINLPSACLHSQSLPAHTKYRLARPLLASVNIQHKYSSPSLPHLTSLLLLNLPQLHSSPLSATELVNIDKEFGVKAFLSAQFELFLLEIQWGRAGFCHVAASQRCYCDEIRLIRCWVIWQNYNKVPGRDPI